MNTQFNSNVIWLQLEYKISTLAMFCLYTLPLARPAQAKIQMLTASSWVVTILLKFLLKSLELYK